METKANPTAIPTDESKADCELKAAHTSGPWFWRVDLHARQVSLQSEGNMRQYVMDFVRWAGGAAPRFYKAGLMERADTFASVVEGREHHASWFQFLDHPDARLIAAAPDLLAACEAALAECGHYGSLSFSAVAQLEAAIRKGKGE